MRLVLHVTTFGRDELSTECCATAKAACSIFGVFAVFACPPFSFLEVQVCYVLMYNLLMWPYVELAPNLNSTSKFLVISRPGSGSLQCHFLIAPCMLLGVFAILGHAYVIVDGRSARTTRPQRMLWGTWGT